MPTFFPVRNGDLDSWEINFSTKLLVHAASLGYPPEVISEIQNLITEHRMAFRDMNLKNTEAKAATANNRRIKRQTKSWLTKFVQNLKATNGYTSTIGVDLGVVSSRSLKQKVNTDKPKLRVILNGGWITINFKKHTWSGIKVYSKREDESDFSLLGTHGISPFVDRRQNLMKDKPEQREYYAYFLDKDNVVGDKSDIVIVTV